jgi:hypothetical protein
MHKKIDFHQSEELDFMHERIAAFGFSPRSHNAGIIRNHYILLK